MSDPTPAPTHISLLETLAAAAHIDRSAVRSVLIAIEQAGFTIVTAGAVSEHFAARQAEEVKTAVAEAKFKREQAMHAATRRHWESRGANLVDKAAEVDRLRARLDDITRLAREADEHHQQCSEAYDCTTCDETMTDLFRAVLTEGDTDGP